MKNLSLTGCTELVSYVYETLRWQAPLDHAAINGRCLLKGAARWFSENVAHGVFDRGFVALRPPPDDDNGEEEEEEKEDAF